jgi:hypothetical protein
MGSAFAKVEPTIEILLRSNGMALNSTAPKVIADLRQINRSKQLNNGALNP